MRCCQTIVAVLVCLGLLSGCADDRAKRQASLLNVKTSVARDEFNAAPTPDEKVEVAKVYFEDAPLMTQVISDYMFGRKPVGVTVQTTGGLPNATKSVGHKLKHFFLGKPVCQCE